MSRLIDADTLLDKKDVITINDGHILSIVGIVYEDDIEEAPTVDAVKHGEWKVDKQGYPHIICSLCDVHIPMVAGWCMDAHINYCPNCGAKMDGEEQDDG